MESDTPLPQTIGYSALTQAATERGLAPLGGFHGANFHGADIHKGGQTTILLGPDEPAFWPTFQTSAEALDGAPDPLDRWSARIIGTWADDLGATAFFPSDGPPYPSFYAWALATGHIWASPINLLVHNTAGLWVSFRGALVLPYFLDLPAPTARPCDICTDKPCLSACPVSALTPQGYDVPACKAHIADTDSAQCATTGCAARRACPAGQHHGRANAQSAFHMRDFLT